MGRFVCGLEGEGRGGGAAPIGKNVKSKGGQGMMLRCGVGKGWWGVRGMFVGEYLNLSEQIGTNRKVSDFL